MLAYIHLADAAKQKTLNLANPDVADQVFHYLVDQWLIDYCRVAKQGDIVETRLFRFSYLFDLKWQRLIAAWGISAGRNAHIRDKNRIAGHLLGGDSSYHRGHAIPHRLGGGTDINLVAQKGSVNLGAFRRLENEAIANPGALYFTYWIYGPEHSQKPKASQQGLLKPGGVLQLRYHSN